MKPKERPLMKLFRCKGQEACQKCDFTQRAHAYKLLGLLFIDWKVCGPQLDFYENFLQESHPDYENAHNDVMAIAANNVSANFDLKRVPMQCPLEWGVAKSEP